VGPAGEAPSPQPDVGGRNLPVAIAVGVALAVLFLGSLFWHAAAFSVVVWSLTTLAYVEAGQVLRRLQRRIEVPVLLVATLVMILGAYHAGHAGQAVGVSVLFLGSVLWLLSDGRRRGVVTSLATTVTFGLWVGFLASFGVLLAVRHGPIAVLGVIGAAALSDIGAYAFGVTLGRRPIAPTVSPNKTWEGFVGGLVVATALAVVVLPQASDRFGVLEAAVLALVCGAAAFLGDLVESMVKRDLGVKDLGDLLPGHGGVLDRVDGILFALPVGFYTVELLGRGVS
jgi:phosphatidate cytidylyltransferase